MTSTKNSSGNNETSGIFSHSLIYAAGNIMRQLVGFIMLPIYTNYLAPADYGVIGLLVFALSLIDLVFGARLLQAVPKFYYEKSTLVDQNATVSSALILTTAISVITMSVVLMLTEQASVFLFSTDQFDLVIAFFAVQLVTTAVENYGLLYIRIERRPWLFVSFGAAKLLLQLGMNIWLLVYEDMGVLGIAISGAVSTTVLALLLGAYAVVKVGLAWRWQYALEQVKFCIPLWLAGFAALYTGSANRYYMNEFATLSDVGLFELAVKFSAILTTLIWMPFSQFWQTESFSIYNNSDRAPEIFGNVFQFITLLLMVAAVGISLFSSPIIRLMADSAYYSAADAVSFLAFSAVFWCLAFYANFSFLATGATRWVSRINYSVAVVATLLFFALIPLFGFIGAAIAMLLVRVFQFAFTVIKAKEYFDMELELAPLGLMLLVAAVGIVVASSFPTTSIISEIGYKILVFVPVFLCLLGATLVSARNRSIAMDYWLLVRLWLRRRFN
ncbi:MAG: oligosaccharide flippase family protein [Pseudomonadota bacterium]